MTFKVLKNADGIMISVFDVHNVAVGHVSLSLLDTLSCYIDSLHVVPHMQSFGYGTELLAKAIEYIKEEGVCKYAELVCEKDLQNWYSNRGFNFMYEYDDKYVRMIYDFNM